MYWYKIGGAIGAGAAGALHRTATNIFGAGGAICIGADTCTILVQNYLVKVQQQGSAPYW